MSAGIGIFLIVLGAILTWAVDFTVGGLDIHLIGLILMGAGAVVLIVSLIFAAKGRKTTTVSSGAVNGAGAPVAGNGAVVANGGPVVGEQTTETRQSGHL